MRFMLIILDDEEAQAKIPREQYHALGKRHQAFAEALEAQGKMRDGGQLAPPAKAVRIRPANGGRTVHDGPFAETKEVFGGFYIIECDSKEEAIAWAKQCPIFDCDTIELKQIL